MSDPAITPGTPEFEARAQATAQRIWDVEKNAAIEARRAELEGMKDAARVAAHDRLQARQKIVEDARLGREHLRSQAGADPNDDLSWLSDADVIRMAWETPQDNSNDLGANLEAMKAQPSDGWTGYDPTFTRHAVRDGRELFTDHSEGGAE